MTVVKVFACLVLRILGFFFLFVCLTCYDHLSVLSRVATERRNLFMASLCSRSIAHVYRLGNHHRKWPPWPVPIIPVVIIREHEDVLHAERVRIYGSTLGAFITSVKEDVFFFVCYFMVMLDHIQRGLKFSELLR